MDEMSRLYDQSEANLKLKVNECQELSLKLQERLRSESVNKGEQEHLAALALENKEKTSKLADANGQLERCNREMKNDIFQLKTQNEILNEQVESYREEARHLQGFDIQIVL